MMMQVDHQQINLTGASYNYPLLEPSKTVTTIMTEPDIPVAQVVDIPAIPVAISRPSKRIVLPLQNETQTLAFSDMKQIINQGFPKGLAKSMEKNGRFFPLRIWVVDNSGSMNAQDGHKFIETRKTNDVRVVPCTRWAEIQQTVDYHAQISVLFKSTTMFRMLNDPGRINGPQHFSIGERGEEFIAEDLRIARDTMRNSSPGGVTPLTRHILEIREDILAMEPLLRRDGTKVAIILATDGLPSDASGRSDSYTKKEFRNALRSLEGLPAWVVVRLCTDDEDVVEYYNDLDGQLELSIEVLDDFVGEAKEVYRNNKWLNYGLPLHRAREMGFHHKLFDLLDERKLTIGELQELFSLLFGPEQFDSIPDPQVDWKGFLKGVSSSVAKEKKQWNPITRKVEPWVNIKKLNKTYRRGNCAVM